MDATLAGGAVDLTEAWWDRPEYQGGELALPGQSHLGADDRTLLEDLAQRAQAGRMDLPAMPRAAMEATQLLRNPDVEIADVAACIELDPAMTAQILRHANSALYSPRFPIDTLPRAFSHLGLARLKRVVLEAALKRMSNDLEARALAEREWRFAVACATIARSLARKAGSDPELCYLCGLLHDIGRLPLLQELSSRNAVTTPPKPESPQEIIMESLHCTIGVQVAEAWDLPPAVQDAVGSHLVGRQPGEESLGQFASTRVVEAAADLCHALGLGRNRTPFAVLEAQSLLDIGFTPASLIEYFQNELPEVLRQIDGLG